MSVTNEKIERPVSIANTQQLIPVNLTRTVDGSTQTIKSSSLGAIMKAAVGDVIQASDGKGNWRVSSRATINKWARYKPERIFGPLPISHGKVLHEIRTRKGNNFSLEIPYCITSAHYSWVADVMNRVVYSILFENDPAKRYVGWEYKNPRGDTSQYEQGGGEEYYRLSDYSNMPKDDTDPFYNSQTGETTKKGYNKNAPLPFVTNTNGTIKDDITEGMYIEINNQTDPSLIVTMQNSEGDDLHIQDFVNVADSAGDNDFAWRPVLQVFKTANSQDSDYPAEWYQRAQPYIEVSGDAITSSTSTRFSVSLPVTDTSIFYFQPNSDLTDWYYLCIGIGYCKKKTSLTGSMAWGGYEDGDLFIIPYDEEDLNEGITPFFYPFRVAKYNDRSILFTTLTWFNTGSVRDIAVESSNSRFQLTWDASGVCWLTFEMSKNPTQKAHFIDENTTRATTGYDPMKIKLEEQTSSGKVYHYLHPMTNAGYTAQVNNTAYIETGQRTEKVTLYAKLDIELSNIQGYKNYHVYSYTGTANADWAEPASIDAWVDNGNLDIYKESRS